MLVYHIFPYHVVSHCQQHFERLCSLSRIGRPRLCIYSPQIKYFITSFTSIAVILKLIDTTQVGIKWRVTAVSCHSVHFLWHRILMCPCSSY
jgi:hypothetical protein